MELNCLDFTETREEELVPGFTDDTRLQRSNERRGGLEATYFAGEGQ